MSKRVIMKTDYGDLEVKRVAVYCRISTARAGQQKSLDSQIRVLLDVVNRRINWKLAGIYTDIGSGRNADSRKELKRLLKDCEDGNVTQIVTKSVSRFGRNTVAALEICRKLKDRNIDVYFVNEDIHSISPDGELTLTLISAISEGESYNKSQSVKWGIERQAEDETSSIYSRPCYGYKKDEEGCLVVVEKEAAVVKIIFTMYLEGMSCLAIKRSLESEGIKSPSENATWPKATIEKMLRNEKYCGDVMVYKTYIGEYPTGKRIKNSGEHKQFKVEDHHPAIVDRETFENVQRAIADRSRKKSGTESTV